MSLPSRAPHKTVKMRSPAGVIVDVALSRGGDNPYVRRERHRGGVVACLEPGWTFVDEEKPEKK